MHVRGSLLNLFVTVHLHMNTLDPIFGTTFPLERFSLRNCIVTNKTFLQAPASYPVGFFFADSAENQNVRFVIR